MTPQDVDVVVCTMNSAASIRQCLQSLREANVAQIIVVDAHSTDGTAEIARELADLVLTDPGVGLGNARNVGIAHTTAPLVLNMGSDNVLPPKQLDIMISDLVSHGFAGVSAQTRVAGENYAARGLNAWRTGRFPPGISAVIGTPTLFRGDLLRSEPFDPHARFSDDSELCQRWRRRFGATFGISPAFVTEIGKATWAEVFIRTRMYGMSDAEVFERGRNSGWSPIRQVQSLAHPARVDLLEPMTRLPLRQSVEASPFLLAFTGLRYLNWAQAMVGRRRRRHG